MPPFISAQLQFVSDAGDKTFLVSIIGLISIVLLFINGYKRESIFIVAASLSTVFSYLLKFIFREPRPAGAKPAIVFDQYSFPSSHTLTYTVFFGFIIYLCFKLTGIPLPIRIVAAAISVYFISLVGISRVYLGEHYVWDVAAGYIFGLLYLLILIALDKNI